MIIRLLTGISLAALATSAVSAQTSTFSQVGNNNTGNVDNVAPGNVGNASLIIQNGDDNTALVYQRGLDNSSTIQQFGTANIAAHGQYSGNRNRAESYQGVRSGGSDDQNSTVRQSGDDNTATVYQDGQMNSSTVDQGVAVVGGNVENRSTGRNRATIEQLGGGLRSTVGQRGVSPGSSPASDNIVLVRQRSATQVTQLQQVSNILQTSRGNRAEVFQFEGSAAAPNSSTIEQRNTIAPGNPSTTNTTSVAQRGQGNQSNVTQDGLRNSAYVTMQQGGTGAFGNQARITQIGSDLVARTVSSGSTNSLEVEQTATLSSVAAWQQLGGSSNSILVRQGTGAANIPVNGNAPGGVTGSAATGNSADVTQGGFLNGGTVNQDGVLSTAIIQQFGSGTVDPSGLTGTAGTYQNRVLIQQTGTGQYANVYQASTVGASGGTGVGPEGPESGPGEIYGTVGGRRSAEVAILQSNSGNSATVQQYGRGQYARIEQSGTGGIASIMQTVDATNATAIIYQLGTDNSYNIEQSVPGSYIRVTQTGTGNSATSVVTRP